MKNPTYYKTIVSSDIWKEWTKYAEENHLFDMAESIECGWLSSEHWNTFINWVRKERIINWLKERCEHNMKTYGTDKWNSDLEDLIEMLSE